MEVTPWKCSHGDIYKTFGDRQDSGASQRHPHGTLTPSHERPQSERAHTCTLTHTRTCMHAHTHARTQRERQRREGGRKRGRDRELERGREGGKKGETSTASAELSSSSVKELLYIPICSKYAGDRPQQHQQSLGLRSRCPAPLRTGIPVHAV